MASRLSFLSGSPSLYGGRQEFGSLNLCVAHEDKSRNTVRDSGVTLTWHNSGEFRWLPCGKEDLIADSILPRDPLAEDVLIQTLRKTRWPRWSSTLGNCLRASGSS